MIRTNSIEFVYEDGTKALNNINLNTMRGNCIGVIGANGSGKSTLFLNLLGTLKPSKGYIEYKGKPLKYDKRSLREYRKEVTMVFQDPEKQLFFSRAYDDVAFALRNLGYKEDDVRERVESALEKVDATELQNKPTHFLSYGQKKRITIAGSLVLNTKIMLLDEPTSGLDPYMSREIKKIVKDLSQSKKLIISSHDMNFIYETCDYIYVLSKGQIIGEGIPQTIFLKKELIEEALLEEPWLVKLHKNLHFPLYKNEEELFNMN